MCNYKPGRRCSNHATSALRQATARLEQAQAKHEAAQQEKPPWAVRRSKESLDKAQRARDVAQLEYDSSPVGMRELAGQMANGASRQERAAARKRLEKAQTFQKDIDAQKAFMPTTLPPAGNPARKSYNDLGKARSELVVSRHLGEDEDTVMAKETNVLTLTLDHERRARRGAADERHLNPGEVAKYREALPGQKKDWATLSYLRGAQRRGGHHEPLVEDTTAQFEAGLGLRPQPQSEAPSAPERRVLRAGSRSTSRAASSSTESTKKPVSGTTARRPSMRSRRSKNRLLDKALRELEREMRSQLDVQPGKNL